MAESVITISQPQSTRPAESPITNERPVNVGDMERWLSLLGGGALALYSLRRSLGNFMLLFGAGALIYRGLTGHCALYQTMETSTVSRDTPPDSTHNGTGPDDTARIVIARS
jgi:hypothetical protein